MDEKDMTTSDRMNKNIPIIDQYQLPDDELVDVGKFKEATGQIKDGKMLPQYEIPDDDEEVQLTA